MKEKDFEIFKRDVEHSVRQHGQYEYPQRIGAILGKIEYLAEQYPDAVLTAAQVLELFDLRDKGGRNK